MCQLIEQLASDSSINVNDANYIFTFISGYLVKKVPVLKQIIEDVFSEAADDKLNDHINKMMLLLQEQQCREKFRTWQMPVQFTIKQSGSEHIL